MSRRSNVYVATLLLVSALAVPSLSRAGSGGVGLGASTLRTSSTSRNGVVVPGDVVLSASGGGITISTRASALLRNELRVVGNVSPARAGETAEVERLGRQTAGAWMPTAHGTVRPDGSFTVVWHTNHIGRFALRAVIRGGRGANLGAATASPTATASPNAAASPTLTVTVYRPALATQYGPGFYGRTTACGEVLRRRTLGVANRTLPCGTPVAIYYQGRTIVVPVIDRGPYANNADWDLTEATGRALGIPGTAMIGAVSLPGTR